MKYPTLAQSINYAAALLVIGAIAYGVGSISRSYFDNKAAVEELTKQTASQNTEIATLRENLSKTEEGKKQVEDAKKASDANAATQSKRASSAEADAAAKGAQLNNVNAQLNSANIQLANVNRCVAKFNGIKSTIERYMDAQVEENRYWNLADKNYVSNYNTYLYYLGLSNDQTAIANNLWPSIVSTLNSVSSGTCY